MAGGGGAGDGADGAADVGGGGSADGAGAVGRPGRGAPAGGPMMEEAIGARLEQELPRWRERRCSTGRCFCARGGRWRMRGADALGGGAGGASVPGGVGRRLGEEAARAVLRYGFEVAGARVIVAGHYPEHEASRRLLVSGFRYSGDELWPPTGLMHPIYRLEGSLYQGFGVGRRWRELVTGAAEADVAVAEAGDGGFAVGDAEVAGEVLEGAVLHEAALRVDRVGVGDPLPDIAEHVVETVRVGSLVATS